jgi:serine/threonine-protein kinase
VVFSPGSQVGRYRVEGPIGRGKPDGLFGVVDGEGRAFAMRSPIADLEDRGTAITDRFGPEAAALRSVMHRNLVPLFDTFVDKGYLCLVTERVRGRTLSAAINAGGLHPRAALIIVRQLLDAAAAAHAAGCVHRALQPSCVLLVQMHGWELAKVADFGLAMLRDEAVLEFGNDALTGSVRKPAAAYMAPEQVRQRSVDPRTDLYAIGTLIFETLTGRPPYLDSDPQNVMQLQVSGRLPNLDDVAPDARWKTTPIKDLINHALAKEREERFQSAAQMIQAVELAYASIRDLALE